MHRVLVLGAGNIGSLIAVLLASSKDYHVYLVDVQTDFPHLKSITAQLSGIELVTLDASNTSLVEAFIKKNKIEILVSSLPYYCNAMVATLAKNTGISYFDLTEDRETTQVVSALSNQNASQLFVPQCGLAPGFISVITHELMRHFATLDTVKMRVGALPINISNALQYSLTWSTDGLINEYGNLCNGIENGEEVSLLPLDDVEEIKIDGLTYEAFNTSGGIGSLANSYVGKVKQLTYKTIRYPGHCEKMRFLMNDLKLNQDRTTLKRILETALPKTSQDVVLVYVSVTGTKHGEFTEENYVKKFYPKSAAGMEWSAIQWTTASELCAVLDIIMNQPKHYHGLVRHEQFSLEQLISNRFGEYYA